MVSCHVVVKLILEKEYEVWVRELDVVLILNDIFKSEGSGRWQMNCWYANITLPLGC